MVLLELLLLGFYALATALSFAAEWYIGELAASLRWQWLVGGAVLMLFFLVRRRFLFLAAATALSLYHVPAVLALVTSDREVMANVQGYRTVHVLQHNTYRFHDNAEAVIGWLKEHGGKYDVVFLQEVSPKLKDRLGELSEHYPYIIPAFFEQRFDNAVLSKFPISSFEIRMFPDLEIGYIVCRFAVEGKTLVMYGMHATAPVSPAYFHARNGQFFHIAREIYADPEEYKFLVGDFNLTPYSPVFRAVLEVSGLENSMEGFGLENTWGSFLPARMFGLPIDHLLTSPALHVRNKQVGVALGSDHFSVATDLLFPARPARSASSANPDSRRMATRDNNSRNPARSRPRTGRGS